MNGFAFSGAAGSVAGVVAGSVVGAGVGAGAGSGGAKEAGSGLTFPRPALPVMVGVCPLWASSAACSPLFSPPVYVAKEAPVPSAFRNRSPISGALAAILRNWGSFAAKERATWLMPLPASESTLYAGAACAVTSPAGSILCRYAFSSGVKSAVATALCRSAMLGVPPVPATIPASWSFVSGALVSVNPLVASALTAS